MDRLKGLLSRAISFTKHGIDIYGENNMSVFAGYSTLFIVTALFPFVMLLLSIINLLPHYSVEDVINVLFQLLLLNNYRDIEDADTALKKRAVFL